MAKRAHPISVKSGKPMLSELPSGWTQETYGDLLNVVERPVKMGDDDTFRLVTVKRSRGGVVEREILRGRDIKTKGAFEIKTGDFLISNRQIVHGACGIVPPDLEGSIVSGEYTVLNPKNGLSLDWLRHFTHTLFFQQTCFHASIGVDVEKMVFKRDRWLKTLLNVPPSKEQNKIAEVLGCWDSAIKLLERLIEVKKAQKQYHYRQLFVERAERNSWRIHQLVESCQFESGFAFKSEYFSKTTGNRLIRNRDLKSDEDILRYEGPFDKRYEVKNGDLLVGMDAEFLPCLWAGGTSLLNQRVGRIQLDSSRVDKTFLYYALQVPLKRLELKTGSTTVKHLAPKQVLGLLLPMPSKMEQEAIGRFLALADRELFLMRAYSSKLIEMRHGLTQQLLSGKLRVKV